MMHPSAFAAERRSVNRVRVSVRNDGLYTNKLRGPKDDCSASDFVAWVIGVVALAPPEYQKYVRFAFSGYSDDKMNAWAEFYAYYYRPQTTEEAAKEIQDEIDDKKRQLDRAERKVEALRRELNQ